MEDSVEHAQRIIPVQVWVDVDEKIAPLVVALNALPGCRTFYSCEGHEHGEDKRAYVAFAWRDEAQLDAILAAVADMPLVVVEILRVGHCIMRLTPLAIEHVAHELAKLEPQEKGEQR